MNGWCLSRCQPGNCFLRLSLPAWFCKHHRWWVSGRSGVPWRPMLASDIERVALCWVDRWTYLDSTHKSSAGRSAQMTKIDRGQGLSWFSRLAKVRILCCGGRGQGQTRPSLAICWVSPASSPSKTTSSAICSTNDAQWSEFQSMHFANFQSVQPVCETTFHYVLHSYPYSNPINFYLACLWCSDSAFWSSESLILA